MAEGLFTLEELVDEVGARFVGASIQASVAGASIDTRTIASGELFFALKGEKSDGHDFLEAAFRAGAVGAVVRRDYWEGFSVNLREAGSFVLVDDPLGALQATARMYLRRFPDLKKIAVTGSNGKTTTKEFIAAILAREEETYYSAGNFNSEIGLPLAVLGLRAEHRCGVFEMATNRVGEIELLASILKPDVAVVTNIGSAHIGMFGSREAIALEKGAVFSRFDDDAVGLVPATEPFKELLTAGKKGRFIEYGPGVTPGVEGFHPRGLAGGEIIYRGEDIHCALPGLHNLHNACAAIAVAQVCGASDEAIAAGIGAVEPTFGRSQFIEGPVSVLQDCYNANLESLTAGVEVVAELDWSTGRKIGVLGSMKELGDRSDEIHRLAGELCAQSGFDAWFFLGREAREAFTVCRNRGGRESVWESDFESLSERVSAYVREGDLVYLKGSRSMGLERLADRIGGTPGRRAC